MFLLPLLLIFSAFCYCQDEISNFQTYGVSSKNLIQGGQLAIDQTGNVYCSLNGAGIYSTGHDITSIIYAENGTTSNSATRISSFSDELFIDIVKQDSLLNPIWIKGLISLNMLDPDTTDPWAPQAKIHDIEIDNDGNLLLAGSFRGQVDFDPSVNQELKSAPLSSTCAFIAKYNNTGGLIWVNTMFNLSGFYRIVSDHNNNILITGFIAEEDTVDFDPSPTTYELINNNSFGTHIAFAKYDENGVFAFANKLETLLSTWDYMVGIDVDLNDNIYLFSTFYGIIDFDTSPGTLSLDGSGGKQFLVKFNPLGSLIWGQCFGGQYTSDYSEQIKIHDGSIFVAHTFSDSVDFNPTAINNYHNPTGNIGYYISKFDTSGNYSWTTTINDSLFNYGYFRDINIKGGNKIVLIGQSNPELLASVTLAAELSNPANNLIVTLDTSGSNIKYYSMTGSMLKSGSSVILGNQLITTGHYTATLNINVAGTFLSLIPNGIRDIIIYATELEQTVDVQQLSPNQQSTIYPNPTSDFININNSQELKIYNTMGQLVLSEKNIGEETVVDVSQLANGIYYVILDHGYQKLIKN